jgi:hypothetical protein
MLLKGNHMAATTITLVRHLTMAAILATLAISPLQAATPDVGLVTGLSGEVTYWNPAENQLPAKARAFLKIRQGDHFKLSTGAVAQLTFFASGRQETWKGPVTVHVGSAESLAPEKQPSVHPAEVKVLSSKVTKRMVAAPMVVARSDAQTSGVSQVMRETRSTGVIQTMAPKKVPAASPPPGPLSPQAQKEVAEAEQVYQDLKKQAKAGDRTPEIYLLSVYADHGQREKMQQVIDAWLAKQPDDQTLKELKAWVRAQAAEK